MSHKCSEVVHFLLFPSNGFVLAVKAVFLKHLDYENSNLGTYATSRFHSTNYIDRIAEQAVAGHLQTHNTSNHRASMAALRLTTSTSLCDKK